MERKTLKLGKCACCDNKVLSDKFMRLPECKELWVLYNDGTNCMFFVCEGCLEKMTLEKAQQIQLDQRYTWGREILDVPLSVTALHTQLEWYIKMAVFLEVVKFAKGKDGLST